MTDTDELRQLLHGWPRLAVTTTADCYGVDPDEEDETWCLFDPEEDDPPIADRMLRSEAERICTLVNAVSPLLTELEEVRSAARAMRHHYELFRERVHNALTDEEGMTPGLRLDDIRKAEAELAEGLASMTGESSDAE